MAWGWTPRWICGWRPVGYRRAWHCRAIWIRWFWLPVATGWDAKPARCSPRCGACLRYSTSATASCHRRRRSTLQRWWSRCVRPRIAVVLFNLGGPDRPEAIRPFLINLFTDPAILRVPPLVRPLLARRIAGARLEPARAAYA